MSWPLHVSGGFITYNLRLQQGELLADGIVGTPRKISPCR